MEKSAFDINAPAQKVEVELFDTEEHKDYFKDIFPKALDKVKELAEQA